MSELFGPLPRHAIAGVPLALAVMAPLVAAAVVAVLGPWLDERPGLRGLAQRAGARAPVDLVAALGGFAAAVIVALGLVAAATAPSGLAVSPAWALVRTGSIEATLGFDADVGRGLVALVFAIGGAIVALRGGPSSALRQTTKMGWSAAWRALAIAAALAALLADGLGTALLALGGALVATGAGSIRGRWAPGAASLLALTLAGATLAWGLDGRWLDGLGGNFLSDYGPRFVGVRDGPPQSARARGPVVEPKGSITMTSTPGAEVFVGITDDASLRGRSIPIATSPFRQVPVAATIQKIAIVPGAAAIVGGDGIEIGLCDNVDIRAGDDVVVTPVGGTWTWRDIEAQLLLHDLEGKHPLLSELATKRLASASLPTTVILLAFLAALLAWLDGPRRIARALATSGPLDASLVGATLAVATVAPVSRLAMLVPLAGAAALIVVAVAAIAFGVYVASSRGRWLAAGAATVVVGAALVAVAADAPPVVALSVALLAALTPRFAESEVKRAPHPWIAGPDEGDPVLEVEPPPPPPAPRVDPPADDAPSPPAEPQPKRKKASKKKAAEVRS